MSICSQLVAQMGGRLKIHSQVGAGSSFYFTLKCPVVYEQNQNDGVSEGYEDEEDSAYNEEREAREAEDELRRTAEERDAAEADGTDGPDASLSLSDSPQIRFHESPMNETPSDPNSLPGGMSASLSPSTERTDAALQKIVIVSPGGSDAISTIPGHTTVPPAAAGSSGGGVELTSMSDRRGASSLSARRTQAAQAIAIQPEPPLLTTSKVNGASSSTSPPMQTPESLPSGGSLSGSPPASVDGLQSVLSPISISGAPTVGALKAARKPAGKTKNGASSTTNAGKTEPPVPPLSILLAEVRGTKARSAPEGYVLYAGTADVCRTLFFSCLFSTTMTRTTQSM